MDESPRVIHDSPGCQAGPKREKRESQKQAEGQTLEQSDAPVLIRNTQCTTVVS